MNNHYHFRELFNQVTHWTREAFQNKNNQLQSLSDQWGGLWISLNSLVDSLISDWFSPVKTKLHEFLLWYNYSSVHWHKYWPFLFRSLWCTTMSLHRRFIKEHVLITFSQFYSWSPSLCVLLQLGGALQGKRYILSW